MVNAFFVSKVSTIPLVSTLLRKIANRFQEGSIVPIRSGVAKGMLWKRYHRYVNGYWVGIYELPLQERISMELEEGDVFYDIGANAGFFSLIAAKIVGRAGHVLAFEPLPMNIQVIEEQFQINKLAQCRCIPYAIGKEDGTCELVLFETAKGQPATSTARLAEYRMNVFKKPILSRYLVDVKSLDNFIEHEGFVPQLIKIDVEGAESDVLYGGKELLCSSKAPRIFIETHGKSIARDVDYQLREAGYRFFNVYGKQLPDGLTERHYLAYPPWLDKGPFQIS